MERIYACIDLKSFYASCECVLRGLNPLTTNLVVADLEKTEKTICLAVSPSLKSYGLKGRARLYEVIQKINDVNSLRKKTLKGKDFDGKSFNNEKIKMCPNLAVDYIVAKPQMKKYIEYSTMIYNVYLKHVAKEDIYVYSIDEVFLDITNYLKYARMTKEEFVTNIILDILKTTGITATGGIGTNLYLAKIAMDIMAKHEKANEQNVRIAFLDEKMYREKLWSHRPLTDFWRVGVGYAKRLEEKHLYTMGDICLMSLRNEEVLYQMFGVNAELLIDHAWGYEPCSIYDIKNYKPSSNSLSRGQVLPEGYNTLDAQIVAIEMSELLSLDLVFHHYLTNDISLTICYDTIDNNISYQGKMTYDRYGRKIPKESHGNLKLEHFTSSSKIMMEKTKELFDKIIYPKLLVRRIYISVNNLIKEDELGMEYEQIDLFKERSTKIVEEEKEGLIKEKKVQKAIIDIKKKYGKNAVLRGINLEKGATTIKRNQEIGGHHE